MTTKHQSESRRTRPATERPAVDRSATTQVGQVIQSIGKLTQRLSTNQPRSRGHLHQGIVPSREHISGLIAALGDPQHPDHVRAVDALVEIGSPAVPALTEALDARQPWLTAYRAAEALGYIGDSQATGVLLQAVRHANSNVRWSAVRALAQMGDLRGVLALRRVAHEDHGRTSWGESVAGTAQSALEQMRIKAVWNQSLELIKTAITSVLMILALILAYNVVTTLQSELDKVGQASGSAGGGAVVAPDTTAAPAAEADPANEFVLPTLEPSPQPTLAPLPTPTATPEQEPILGTVLQAANVRPVPSTENRPLVQLNQGEQVIFVGRSADGDWYLVRPGPRSSDRVINNPDGSGAGWISASLVSRPVGDVPVVEPGAANADSEPTATPEP